MIDAVAGAAAHTEGAARGLSSRDDFMTLLVAQLRAQDPLKPMDPSEFMSQLAQLQTVSELGTISSLLAQSYYDQRLDGAFQLIGRTVSWHDPASAEALSGQVESIDLTDGQMRLVVGEHRIAPGLIRTVS